LGFSKKAQLFKLKEKMAWKVDDLIPNESNPRIISEEDLKKLSESIARFPKMMKLRPIVVDKNKRVLGGNQRLKAIIKLGMAEVPDEWVRMADELTEEEVKMFIVQDNTNAGEWDWAALRAEYTDEYLASAGVDFSDAPKKEEDKDPYEYTKKILSPIYEPSGERHQIDDLFDDSKTQRLLEEIRSSNLTSKVKSFLEMAAYRHTVFDFGKIADFYAEADKKLQEMMENSALVVVDFDKAIEEGFVKLTEEVRKLYLEEKESKDND
jgi:hypothetical protein